jgi:hypothetical protein
MWAAPPAFADPVEDRLRAIEAQNAKLQREIEALKDELAKRPAPADAAPPVETVPPAPTASAPVLAAVAPAVDLNRTDEEQGVPEALPAQRTFVVYGFAQADYIQDFNRVDPKWLGAFRPSKIPTTTGLYGANGQSDISVKQSRFGVTADTPLGGRVLATKFEFDLYGTGVDAGQTTFRLRHAYGEWGPILVGQTNSLFMDGDVFPNVIDYWGPSGMVFLRNPQVRYTLFNKGGTKVAIAIERPGNDIDPGNIREIDPDLAASIQNREPVPDFTAQWRTGGSWGHVQVAGLLRDVAYDTAGQPGNHPKGETLGGGIDVGASYKITGRDTIRAAVVYGVGIASYMNDGGTDLAPRQNEALGLEAKALPLLGVTAYIDHNWSDRFSSALGYSRTQVDNTNFQAANAFKSINYASINLLYAPLKEFLFGGELLWGDRTDNDGRYGHDWRFQFSAKYAFSSGNLLGTR